MYKYLFLFFPIIATALFVLIGVAGFYVDGRSNITPFFVAISVFYWGIYTPKLMPSWIVFILGVCQDALYGSTLGVSAVMLLLLLVLVRSKSSFVKNRSFIKVWLIFALTMFIFALLHYLLNAITILSFSDLNPATFQLALTIFLYPVLHKLFSLIPIKSKILRS